MPAPPINFADFSDGIDWPNAIPPHILMRQAHQQMSRLRQQPHSFLLDWPLTEDSFPMPPAARMRREGGIRGTSGGETRIQGGSRNTLSQGARSNQQAHSRSPMNAGGRVSQTWPQQLHQQMLSMDDPFSFLASTAGSMMDSHRSSMVSILNDLVEMQQGILESTVGIRQGNGEATAGDGASTFRGQNVNIFEGSGSRTTEERGPSYARISVTVQASSSTPPQVIAEVERGTLGPRQRLRHPNRGSAEYDIITGLGLGPRARHSPSRIRGPRGSNEGGWEISDFSFENLQRLDNRKVNTGLPAHQIRGMKPVPYAKVPPKKSAEGGSVESSGERAETCPICLEAFSAKAMVLKIECGHTFHHGCITKWFRESNHCPTCRYEIPRKGGVRM